MNYKISLFVSISFGFIFSGCMTSARQDQLQLSIDQLRNQLFQIQSQIHAKDQQITNTTQTAISSQSNLQNVENQLQLVQGALDEQRARIKKIEETAGSSSNPADQSVLAANTETIARLRRDVARIDLQTFGHLTWTRRGPLPIKTLKDLEANLKTNYEKGNFKGINATATQILSAAQASPEMLAMALDYRGEARFHLQDYRGAAIDLSTHVNLYPKSPRHVRALLFAGDSYVYLKNYSIAELYYKDCSSNFSDTAEGKACSSRLSSLAAQKNGV